MTCVTAVTKVDGVGGLWAPHHFHWNPPIFLFGKMRGGIGLFRLPSRLYTGPRMGLARYARARAQVSAREETTLKNRRFRRWANGPVDTGGWSRGIGVPGGGAA